MAGDRRAVMVGCASVATAEERVLRANWLHQMNGCVDFACGSTSRVAVTRRQGASRKQSMSSPLFQEVCREQEVTKRTTGENRNEKGATARLCCRKREGTQVENWATRGTKDAPGNRCRGLLREKLNWLFFRGSPSAALVKEAQVRRRISAALPDTGPPRCWVQRKPNSAMLRGLTLLRASYRPRHLLDLLLMVFSPLLWRSSSAANRDRWHAPSRARCQHWWRLRRISTDMRRLCVGSSGRQIRAGWRSVAVTMPGSPNCVRACSTWRRYEPVGSVCTEMLRCRVDVEFSRYFTQLVVPQF